MMKSAHELRPIHHGGHLVTKREEASINGKAGDDWMLPVGKEGIRRLLL